MSVASIETLPRVRRVSLKDIERFMNKKTDTAKCLQILQEAGDRGVHSFDLNRLINTTRAAARIQDLKNSGWHITSIFEKRGESHGCRYFLTSSSQPISQFSKKPVKKTIQGYFDNARGVFVYQ